MPLSTRAEIYYEASNEVCYNEEEQDSLRARLQECQIRELDLHTMESAYKTCQARGGSCSFQWSTFGMGIVSGLVITAIVSAIVQGGR